MERTRGSREGAMSRSGWRILSSVRQKTIAGKPGSLRSSLPYLRTFAASRASIQEITKAGVCVECV